MKRFPRTGWIFAWLAVGWSANAARSLPELPKTVLWLGRAGSETQEVAAEKYRPLADYLTQYLHRRGYPEVEVRSAYYASYTELLKNLEAGHVQLMYGYDSIYAYAWAAGKARALVARSMYAESGQPEAEKYTCVLLGYRGCPGLRFADERPRPPLRERLLGLRGKRFAMDDPISFSASILPRKLLAPVTTDVNQFFGEIVFLESQWQIIEKILTREVDAGAVGTNYYHSYWQPARYFPTSWAEPQAPPRLTDYLGVVAQYGEEEGQAQGLPLRPRRQFLHGPICYNPEFFAAPDHPERPGYLAALKEAFLQMSRTAQGPRSEWQALAAEALRKLGVDHFVEARDEDYAEEIELVSEVEGLESRAARPHPPYQPVYPTPTISTPRPAALQLHQEVRAPRFFHLWSGGSALSLGASLLVGVLFVLLMRRRISWVRQVALLYLGVGFAIIWSLGEVIIIGRQGRAYLRERRELLENRAETLLKENESDILRHRLLPSRYQGREWANTPVLMDREHPGWSLPPPPRFRVQAYWAPSGDPDRVKWQNLGSVWVDFNLPEMKRQWAHQVVRSWVLVNLVAYLLFFSLVWQGSAIISRHIRQAGHAIAHSPPDQVEAVLQRQRQQYGEDIDEFLEAIQRHWQDRQRAHGELQESNERLAQAKRELERAQQRDWVLYTAGLAHNFRRETQLYLDYCDELRRFVEGAEPRLTPAEALDRIQYIHDTTNDRGSFFQFLHALGFRTVGLPPPAHAPDQLTLTTADDLERFLQEAFDRQRRAREAQGFTVQKTLAPPQVAPSWPRELVFPEKPALMFIFRELFNNALRYSSQRCTIETYAAPVRDHLVFGVAHPLLVHQRDRAGLDPDTETCGHLQPDYYRWPRYPHLGWLCADCLRAQVSQALTTTFAHLRRGEVAQEPTDRDRSDSAGLGLFLINFFIRDFYQGELRAGLCDERFQAQQRERGLALSTAPTWDAARAVFVEFTIGPQAYEILGEERNA